jgi:hypothetical protein
MFTKDAPSMRWRCAVGAASLLVLLQVGSPARGDDTTVSAQTHGQRAPLPRPGTYRLIRIGPQALVKEDDHGKVTMVDEQDGQTADELGHKPGRAGQGAAVVIGLFTAGAVLIFGRVGPNEDYGVRLGPR